MYTRLYNIFGVKCKKRDKILEMIERVNQEKSRHSKVYFND